MKIITLFAVTFAVVSAHAGQGVVLSPGQTLTFPIANTAPFSSLQSTRLELRVHAWSVPAGITTLVSVPGLQVRFSSPAYNAPLIITDWLDTFAPGAGNGVSLQVGALSDMILRVERDLVGGNLIAQVWSADGTGQVITASLPIAAPGIAALPDQGYIGDVQTAGVLDYVRWFSTTVPLGTLPFNFSVGDLADFEFDGTLTDSSPQNLVLSKSASISYAISPSYAPLAYQGSQRVFNASQPQSLDATGSTALNGASGLTYQWSQISGPSQLQFDSLTSIKPNITGLVFGSYQIQLAVTDSTGVSSSNVIKYGSVVADSRDVVIPSQPYITQILGPMLRLGASPWPYFDTSNQSMANFFGGLQSTTYLDVWNQAQPGTISLVNGSTAVTGSGTAFLSTFCGGGNAGFNGATIVIGYPVPGSPGQWGRVPYGVASCQSDSALTLFQPYNTTGSVSNLSFASMNNVSVGNWINGSSNANYYDNVMAFYSLYYRSGIDDYLTYAETLADRWYTMPWFDQGRASLNGSTTLFPRMQSLTGLILRAFDGHPEYWNGIRLYLNYDFAFASNAPTDGFVLTDVREQGYATAFLALGALFDPLPSNRATYNSQLESVISNVWVPAMQPAGNWVNTSFGYSSWNGNGGLANVTKGSTIVTGTSTTWQPGWFTNNAFWTADPNGVTNGDAIAYTATVISSNQLSLNIPYQGNTASGRGWQTNLLVGSGTQPYMLGIAARAFNYAYLATGDARLPGFLTGVQSWIASQGYRPDARGLWYGRVFPNCEPISMNNQACNGGTVEQSRFLSGEIIGSLAAAALLPGNSSTTTFGDNVFGAMFGGPTGGPDADSTFVTDVSDGGWAMVKQVAKDFGFFYGFGGGPTWPAARLLAASAPPPPVCTYSLGQSSASFSSTGGTGTFSINASSGACTWTSSSSVPWITITSAPSGTGSASVSYSVAPFSGAGTQTGIITAAGQTFTVTQTGATCSLTLGVSGGYFGGSGGSASITVAASAPSCSWTAVSNASFLTLNNGSSGTGSGSVSYSVTGYTGSGTRVGTLTVAGKTFTVTQSAPSGTDLDIGSPALAGNLLYSNGVYVVTGAGAQIGGTMDHFNFALWQTGTKQTFTARLVSLAGGNGNAKAGVMIRQSLYPSAANMLTFATPTQAGSQVRTSGQANTSANGTGAISFPIWLRVVIAGNVMTSYSSPDGKSWTMLGSPQTFNINAAPFAGLAVTSTNPSAISVATFDNVSITPN